MMKLLYIDLFCGAGGTSTGVNSAKVNGIPCARVIACVNHDANAIASHSANHPDALHFTEDIRTMELAPMVDHLAKIRENEKDSKVVLWASLECTNFSKAKGGLPRDADSRTLAEHLFRYIKDLDPDYIQIENVEEFMSWGDIDKNGHPVSANKGKNYIKWVENVKAYGYNFKHRILNAADYGAYTSRRRFFGIFAKHGLPIAFPEATHSKTGNDLFGTTQKWKPVKEVLDFADEGKTIFRDKGLSEKTLERIYAGLIKFVAGGQKAFLLKYNSTNQKTGKHIPPSIEEPCPVISCQNRLGLIQVTFLSKQFSGNPSGKNISVEGPAGTITTRDHHVLVQAQHFIDNQYGNGCASSVESPAGTITTNPKQNLVTCRYLMNPQFSSAGRSVDRPCFTQIARMDKRPPYLVSTEKGETEIEVYKTDSPTTVKIKEFMALYGIVDIKMRMLKVSELKRITGFPDDYVLIGTKAEQKKYIGNAVEVNMARVLCEALFSAIINI